MNGSKMKVKASNHTLLRTRERGTDPEEIEEVLRTGSSIPAKYGRMAIAKVFEFRRERNGKFYEQKRVEVYYIIEGDTAVTITAYVFFGKWEE